MEQRGVSAERGECGDCRVERAVSGRENVEYGRAVSGWERKQ